jgi:hypothetical protein
MAGCLEESAKSQSLALVFTFETQLVELLGSFRPALLGGFSKDVEYSVDLIEVVCPWEEGSSEVEFNGHAGEGEDVDGWSILLGSQ